MLNPEVSNLDSAAFAWYQGTTSVRDKSEKTPFFLKRATKPSS
jgi:hypothetical protein